MYSIISLSIMLPFLSQTVLHAVLYPKSVSRREKCDEEGWYEVRCESTTPITTEACDTFLSENIVFFYFLSH